MERITRREFLKKSMMTGLALSSAFSYSRILGANDEIRIAVIGIRSKGAQHIDVFHALPDVRVVALCDVDQEILDREAKKFIDRGEKVETYRDVRKLLDDKNIDVVVIATPNHWHSLIGIWACQAGKDIYVEKPISHNIWEGRKLVEAARKYNRIVQAGTQNRSDVGFREAIAYINEGQLGKILWSHGLWYKERDSIGKVDAPQLVPKTIDYDLWTGPALLKPLMRQNLHYDWHWFWDTGNGDMGNLGAHQIDDCRFAMALAGYPTKVMSFGGRFVFDDNGETPNTQVAFFDYEPAPVIIEVRNLPRTKGQQAMDHLRGVRMGNIIQCENGYFAGGRGGGWVYDNYGKKIKQFPGDGGGDHQLNFIEAVRNRKTEQLHADILEGHISAVLCHIANISYQIGKAAQFDEMKEAILENPDAKETVERVKEHLTQNEVKLDKNPMIVGPWISLAETKEEFVGEFASLANKFVKRETYREPFVVPERV